MIKIPNRRFTHIISPLGDAFSAVLIGTIGFLLYDTKSFKPDRPDQASLFQLLRKELPTKLLFLKIERKEANFEHDKEFEEYLKASSQK